MSAPDVCRVVEHNGQGVPSLVDVLCKLAANWVLCECGTKILEAGCDGLKRKIDSLSDQIPRIEAPSEKEAMQADLAILEAQSEALNQECEKAHDEADAYCELFGEACEFCKKKCSIGANEVFNAALVDFDPTRLQPDQGPSEDRMLKIVSRLDDLHRDKWKTQPWGNPTKPTMRAARRVTPNHRNQFIARNLKSGSPAVESGTLKRLELAADLIIKAIGDKPAAAKTPDMPGPEFTKRADVRGKYFKVWAFVQKPGNARKTNSEIVNATSVHKDMVARILSETRPPLPGELEPKRTAAKKR